MAKKPSTKSESELPSRFEIITKPSAFKLVRERDNRVQWTSLISMFVGFGLVLSVSANVYQSISTGGFILLAQDIRSAELTFLQPLPPEQQLRNAKIGNPPRYTEEFLAKIENYEKNRKEFLDSLFTVEGMTAQMEIINAGGEAGKAPIKPKVVEAPATQGAAEGVDGKAAQPPASSASSEAQATPAAPVASASKP